MTSITHSLLTEKRVKVMNPFIFLTDDTEETMKRTGFRQIQVLADESNTGLRGTNRRTWLTFTSLPEADTPQF